MHAGHRSTPRRSFRSGWKLWASVWCAVALWAVAVVALSTTMRSKSSVHNNRGARRRRGNVGEDETLHSERDVFITQMQSQQERAAKRHYSELTQGRGSFDLGLRSPSLRSF